MPDWAETTVRWLRKNYPLLTPTASKKPFPELLVNALVKANYQKFEMMDKRGFSKAAWVNAQASQSTSWTKVKHDNLVKFLAAGGYEALSGAGVRPDAFVVESDGGAEAIEIEMSEHEDQVDDDLIEEAVNALKRPPEQISPRHELEEIVADASRVADPRYGVW